MFSLLLITNISVYGMEALTKQICVNNNWQEWAVRRDFNVLSLTDKSFYLYYADDGTQRDTVRAFAHKNNIVDFKAAQRLGCEKIQKRMNHFCIKMHDYNQQFTADELKNNWYFNSTMLFPQEPLFYALIRIADVNKLKTVVESGIVINNKMARSPFVLIQERQSNRHLFEQDKRDLIAIAQLLIDNKTYQVQETNLLLNR